MNTRRWFILIVLVGATLRLFPIWFGLPYLLARPDEEVSIRIAHQALFGDFNPRFFHWPSLIFYVFATLFWCAAAVKDALGFADSLSKPEQILIGRAFVACAGTLTIGVLFWIARRIAGTPIALVASALLAVSILHVRESHFAMTDVLMTLLFLASLGLLLRGLDESEHTRLARWFAAAGLAGGLAASTKYSGAGILAALAIAQVSIWSRSWRSIGSARSWLPAAAYLVCFGIAFLAATPFALIDYRGFGRGLQFNYVHLASGHGLDLGRGIVYHFVRSLPYGLGVTSFIAGLIGLPILIVRHPRDGIVVGGLVLALYLSLGRGYTVFFRYVLPLVPIMCLSAAIAIEAGAARLSSRVGTRRGIAIGALLLVTMAPGLVNCVWFDWLLARADTRVVAAQWLEERIRPDDTLYDSGSPYVNLDLQHLRFHQWYLDYGSGSFGDPEGRNPDWLIMYDSPVSIYTEAEPVIQSLVRREYGLVHEIRATRGRARDAVYDLQDAFFMPVWGFWTVERPGPTIRIYRRKDLL